MARGLRRGSRDGAVGESTHLIPLCPRFDSRTCRHVSRLSLLLVLVLTPSVFSMFSCFPPSTHKTINK